MVRRGYRNWFLQRPRRSGPSARAYDTSTFTQNPTARTTTSASTRPARALLGSPRSTSGPRGCTGTPRRTTVRAATGSTPRVQMRRSRACPVSLGRRHGPDQLRASACRATRTSVYIPVGQYLRHVPWGPRVRWFRRVDGECAREHQTPNQDSPSRRLAELDSWFTCLCRPGEIRSGVGCPVAFSRFIFIVYVLDEDTGGIIMRRRSFQLSRRTIGCDGNTYGHLVDLGTFHEESIGVGGEHSASSPATFT